MRPEGGSCSECWCDVQASHSLSLFPPLLFFLVVFFFLLQQWQCRIKMSGGPTWSMKSWPQELSITQNMMRMLTGRETSHRQDSVCLFEPNYKGIEYLVQMDLGGYFLLVPPAENVTFDLLQTLILSVPESCWQCLAVLIFCLDPVDPGLYSA